LFIVTEQATAQAVRDAREARGLSLRALAGRLGISPGTLSAVERGLTPLTVDRLEQIARTLDVPAAQLLSGAVPAVATSESSSAPAPDEEPGHWRSFADLRMDPVLEAATRLFVRRGYHAATMREIAAEANLSVAGVYHHYPSKERILVALLDLTMVELAWRIDAARQEGRDPLESLALMVEALALFHAVRGDLAFVGASEMRAFGPAERARITGLRDDIQHALDRQAQACADAGYPVAGDLRTATRAIATMCTSLPSWFRPEGALSASEVARRYAAYALALLGAGRSEVGGQ
jgi:AcrR family transcriptional regulator